jgi:hypothetical protein
LVVNNFQPQKTIAKPPIPALVEVPLQQTYIMPAGVTAMGVTATLKAKKNTGKTREKSRGVPGEALKDIKRPEAHDFSLFLMLVKS